MKMPIISLAGCLLLLGQGPPAVAAPDYSSPFLDAASSKRISMDFESATLTDVLKIFSQQTGLNLITSEDIAAKQITMYLANVPVEEALDQVLRAYNLTYEIQPGSNIYIVKQRSMPDAELVTRVYQLKYATVSSSKLGKTLSVEKAGGGTIGGEESAGGQAGLLAAVKAILTAKGQVIEDSRTNSLIITDIAANFPRIESTIARLDIPIPQILIEVEMLEVTKSTADLIGVKVGSTPLTFTGGQRDHVYPWNQNRLLEKGFTFEDAEYRVGTISASGLSATLQLLQTRSGTKNLARPRILTLNNEPAQIKISTDEAIGITTQTSSSQNLATSAVQAERVETGVFLTVTPQANVETGEITIAISPKVIVARTGATFNGTTFRDPEERGTQSLLRIQSGDTIIIGGLLREETNKTITKVPLLGDIPLLGQAFRHRDESVTEKELIVFITPHIVQETPVPKAMAANSEMLLREQDVPRRRSQTIDDELSVAEEKHN